MGKGLIENWKGVTPLDSLCAYLEYRLNGRVNEGWAVDVMAINGVINVCVSHLENESLEARAQLGVDEPFTPDEAVNVAANRLTKAVNDYRKSIPDPF